MVLPRLKFNRALGNAAYAGERIVDFGSEAALAAAA